MKAAVFEKYGKIPEVVQIKTNYPKPTISGSNDVIVKVVATSINPIDWKIIEGHVQSFFKVKLPGIRGLDVSGTVAEIGSAVTRFKVGDAVYGKTGALDGGCLAEFVSVPENKLVHKSEKITFEEAASIPLVALTSYQSLKKAGLKSGQHVLILGGSGGTGSIGIQIPKNGSSCNNNYI